MAKIPDGLGVVRLRALWVLALAALIVACSGDGAPEGADTLDASADASGGLGSPLASQEAQRVVEAAVRLAAAAPELARGLAPAAGVWAVEPSALGKAGLRTAPSHQVTARLPALATYPLRVGLGEAERGALRLTPEGAHAATVEEVEGRAVYRDIHPSTDVVYVAGPTLTVHRRTAPRIGTSVARTAA